MTIEQLLSLANVPEELKEEVRQTIIIGTGKTEFTDAEAQKLVKFIKKRSKKVTAGAMRFKVQHKPKTLNTCPVCAQTMIKAKIAGGRQVYYCPKHRVVLPLPVE